MASSVEPAASTNIRVPAPLIVLALISMDVLTVTFDPIENVPAVNTNELAEVTPVVVPPVSKVNVS